MTAIDAKNISVKFGAAQILYDVVLAVETGRFVGLIGPNGSGKTTLLRSLAGLQRLAGGGVSIDGRLLTEMTDAARARKMSYMPQGTEVHWPLVVGRLVALGRIPTLNTWRGARGPDQDAVVQALRAVDALHLTDRVVSNLSTGERARVLLARALASNPGILLADEPVASLDLNHQLLVLDVIRDLCSQGMTAVVVFHNLSLAARYCSHLVLLHEGRVFAEGPPTDVLVPNNLRDAYGVDAVLSNDLGVPQVVSFARLDPAGDRGGGCA
jgi:iron complex transport system ATP-binding protein